MKSKTIIAFLMGGLFFTIMMQNTQVVSLKLLFWKISMSRIILFPLFMLAGFIVGFFFRRR